MCTKPIVWVSEAFSVPNTVFSVWVYSALFSVLSCGILGSLHCAQTLITVLPLCCSYSPTSAIPSSLNNSPSQSIKDSAVSLLYLADRVCLLWGCLSSSVSDSASLTLIAPQQITFICTVTPVMFPCCALDLKIFSPCLIFFFATDSLCSTQCNLSQGFNGFQATVVTSVRLLDLSNVCSYLKQNEMRP